MIAEDLAAVCAHNELVKASDWRGVLGGGAVGAAGGALLGAGAGYGYDALHADPDDNKKVRRKKMLAAIIRGAQLGGIGGGVIGATLGQGGAPKRTPADNRAQATREFLDANPQMEDARGKLKGVYDPNGSWAQYYTLNGGTLGGAAAGAATHRALIPPSVLASTVANRRAVSTVEGMAGAVGEAGAGHGGDNLARLTGTGAFAKTPPVSVSAGSALTADEALRFRNHIAGEIAKLGPARRAYERFRANVPFRSTTWLNRVIYGSPSSSGIGPTLPGAIDVAVGPGTARAEEVARAFVPRMNMEKGLGLIGKGDAPLRSLTGGARSVGKFGMRSWPAMLLGAVTGTALENKIKAMATDSQINARVKELADQYK